MNETDLQMHVVNYIKMQYPKARFCASLGGIRTSISQAKKAKKTGRREEQLYYKRNGLKH